MGLLPEAIDDGINVSYRVPVFDLEIAAQDENPYKTMEYNQLALQLFQLGFFREDMADQALRCLELMEFKNKDRMVSVITEGKTQAKMIARLQSQLMQVAQVVDEAKGTQLAAALAAEYAAVPMTKGTAGGAKNKMSAMDQMRQKTRQAVTPL